MNNSHNLRTHMSMHECPSKKRWILNTFVDCRFAEDLFCFFNLLETLSFDRISLHFVFNEMSSYYFDDFN